MWKRREIAKKGVQAAEFGCRNDLLKLGTPSVRHWTGVPRSHCYDAPEIAFVQVVPSLTCDLPY